MKTGYTILNGVGKGDNIIEVMNHLETNQVVNLGWIFPKTAYSFRTKDTVGVWKIKKLKN